MTAWLLTWLWQGTALALVVSVAFRHLPRVNAATRYPIWWGALFALMWLGWRSSPHSMSQLEEAAVLQPASSSAFAFQVPSLPEWSVTVIVSVWATVALFKLLRILPGLHGLYRLKDACTPMLRSVEERLPLWQEAKRRGRPVQLMFCNELSSAAVLGLHQPCIAFPQRLLDVVSADELDQIVLHEYGHVQRRDDWMRLGQALLEAAAWIHPAAFWICRELNLEREVACDDWVVSRTGAPQAYANCLSRVAGSRQHPVKPVFAPALFGGKGALVRRVDRLLDERRNATRELSLVSTLAGLCFIGTAAVHMSAYSVIVERAERAMPALRAGIGRVAAVDLPPSPAGWQASVNSALRPTKIRGPQARLPRMEPQPGPSRVDLALAPSQSLGEVSPELALEPAEDAIPLVSGRSFNGAHPAVASSDGSPAREAVKGWQLAGTAGANVGKAARKASVDIANAFSRASVSLARSF